MEGSSVRTAARWKLLVSREMIWKKMLARRILRQPSIELLIEVVSSRKVEEMVEILRVNKWWERVWESAVVGVDVGRNNVSVAPKQPHSLCLQQ